MSADEWCECPICKDDIERKEEVLRKKYGTIPVKEYDKLKEEIEKRLEKINDEYEGTPVRMDYELFIDQETRLAKIFFGAECQICGTGWRFENNNIPPKIGENEV